MRVLVYYWRALILQCGCWDSVAVEAYCAAMHSWPPWPGRSFATTASDRRSPVPVLSLPWLQLYWGGGSVFLATAALDWRYFRHAPHSYEHGTLPFLDIIALSHGECTGVLAEEDCHVLLLCVA